jgi:hypothetical protein
MNCCHFLKCPGGAVWLLAGLTATGFAADQWSVTSPNGQVRITLQLADLGGRADYPDGVARLYYRVEHGPANARAVVLRDSPLGMLWSDQNFLDGLRFERRTGPARRTVDYRQPHGKRRHCRNEANAVTVFFRNRGGLELAVDLRAYSDGAALRYRVTGDPANSHRLVAEATGFALPPDARMWLAPADRPSKYAPAYETYYEVEVPVGAKSPTDCGWSFPVLFRTADKRHWGLITEANLGPNYCGARLTSEADGGVYRVRLPEPAEGNGTGGVAPTFETPFTSPWRVVLLGDTPGAIAESTLVDDLSEPGRLRDPSWIRPGRVAWSWWSDPPSPQNGEKQKRFIDLAAEFGWEYVLVDANWTLMDHGTIHDVLRYARKKGVGVLLWYNSGGPHNRVTEKPRGTMNQAEVRRFEFDLLKKWGVKGIKVDFFQSDKQNVIRLYHDLLRDAAAARLMINFHGCTLPRGWSRTWPHLMSMEAVRGEECYIFDPQYPRRAPVQATILPFTRNVVGPMDYTPVGLTKNTYPRLTTTAYELALPVVFESGWLHFADGPAAYLELSEPVKDYLRRVPAAWDDTRFLAGYPGQYVVVARRHGDTWYVAGINGGDRPRPLAFDLKPLGLDAPRQAHLLADGETPQAVRARSWRAAPDAAFRWEVGACGGFVLRLEPAAK